MASNSGFCHTFNMLFIQHNMDKMGICSTIVGIYRSYFILHISRFICKLGCMKEFIFSISISLYLKLKVSIFVVSTFQMRQQIHNFQCFIIISKSKNDNLIFVILKFCFLFILKFVFHVECAPL